MRHSRESRRRAFRRGCELASAAAPLYFPAVRPRRRGAQQQIQTEERTYVDGGLWANNPALLALLELHRQGASFSEIRVVSVGNGEVPSGKIATDFDRMRRAKMLEPVLDMMFATQSELADSACATLLGDEDGARMLRVNVPLERAIDLDDVPEAVQKLKHG